MALSPFGGRRGDDWSLFDPFRFDSFFDWPGRSTVDFPRPRFGGEVSAFASAQVDWRETPEAHIFKANLPGLKKEDVKVQVEDGRVLQISGERKMEETESTDRWHRVERHHGSFMRSFRLPESALVDNVNACMEDGVLTVTVPKRPQDSGTSNVKTIDITG